MRHGPPFVENRQSPETACYYLSINRNKKCVALDLNHPRGGALFRRLAAQVDVVVRNYKPGTMEKWGLGYEEIRKIKPDIIYISDFGIMAAANAGWVWPRMGSRHPGGGPVNIYRCKDDYVFILVALPSHWARFCKILGREELIEDPRTRMIADRARNLDFVDELVSRWTGERTAAEVLQTMEEAELVACPLYDFSHILQDEHIREREMVAEVDHPVAGKVKLFGVAVKHSLTPGKVRSAAPLMGQHNGEIYGGRLRCGHDRLLPGPREV